MTTRRRPRPPADPVTNPAPIADVPEVEGEEGLAMRSEEVDPAPAEEVGVSPLPKGPPILTIVLATRRAEAGPDEPDETHRLNFASSDLEEALRAAVLTLPGGSIEAVEHAGEVIWQRPLEQPIARAGQLAIVLALREGGELVDRAGYAHADILANPGTAGDRYSPAVPAAPEVWRPDLVDVPTYQLGDWELELGSNPDPCSFSLFKTVQGRDLQDALEAAQKEPRRLRAIRKDGVQVWPEVSANGEGDQGEHQPENQ